MPNAPKPSKAEEVKVESRYLRGSILEGLADGETHFSEADSQVLKFHGTYQQHDRDTATARKKKGLEKEYQFMIRVRIPGGRLTADQYLALDRLAERYANGTLRITTRQGIQLHGVLKGDLKATIAEVNGTLLTTLAACGDVVRNVMTTPAPIRDAVHRRLAADARMLSRRLSPRTRAYHEIWLDGERIAGGAGEDEEPLYGARYMPRKFKVALATPADNSVDVLTNDLGIIVLFEGERLVGYNIALGGGLGMTHNKPRTYPRLATPTAFVEPGDLLRAVEAVIGLQRDYGDRSDRRHARLKYLLDDKGLGWIKARLEEYFGAPLEPPRPMPPFKIVDHMGWHSQGGGLWYLGVPISSGRVEDRGAERVKSGLREVIAKYRLDLILTPGQDIILCNVRPEDRGAVEGGLKFYGVPLAEDLSPLRRWSLACPALPTCGLALTEAERIKEPLIGRLERLLSSYGLAEERITVRITGCPNGCARPYLGDIGLVGRMPGYFALYVGGDFEGTRLSERLLDKVALKDIPATLEPLIAFFARHRRPGERFGDFCRRHDLELLRRVVSEGLAKSFAVAG